MEHIYDDDEDEVEMGKKVKTKTEITSKLNTAITYGRKIVFVFCGNKYNNN